MKNQTDSNTIREQVRSNYGAIAQDNSSCCAPDCCGTEVSDVSEKSSKMGYSDNQIKEAPADSNLGLGCGNPLAIASLKPDQVVLDLGSGAGFDSFLASRQVGKKGKVIGVDMTPAMIAKARRNAETTDASNVEFRLGEIEHLPVEDNSIDVIISNCVINLSPEKESVFLEAFRVLKAGGKLAISDVVAFKELDQEIKSNPKLISACIGGASTPEALGRIMKDAGFTDITIEPKSESSELIKDWATITKLESLVVSASISATKPV